MNEDKIENEKNSDVREIISVYDKYIELLDDEISSIIGIAVAHGYTGNETGYQQGIILRDKITQLKGRLLTEDLSVDEEEYFSALNKIVMDQIEYSSLKNNLIKLLDNCNDIELLSYHRYPSCVRNTILSTNLNCKTPEDEWLTNFGKIILEKKLPKYKVPFDNKIAIEFKPVYKEIGEQPCSLWFGYKDNTYSIGLTAENKDGFPPIKIKIL
ncbi:MAG: hypothetical protein FWC41_08880 [Firmicutes bacterium]|nr:hypothetical protein [Bacillota bacterium]